MEKKKYVKPSMMVYEIQGQPQLLAGSGNDGGHMTYIPGQPEDEKQLT